MCIELSHDFDLLIIFFLTDYVFLLKKHLNCISDPPHCYYIVFAFYTGKPLDFSNSITSPTISFQISKHFHNNNFGKVDPKPPKPQF